MQRFQKKGGINPNSALDLSALSEIGISCKIIDVQSLSPFDLAHETVESIQKANRLLIVDEDVPAGASAYLMQEILEVQNGYQYFEFIQSNFFIILISVRFKIIDSLFG